MTSPEEVVSKINDLVIDHEAYIEAREEVLSSIAHGVQERVIVVAGPTGVGKSRLLRDIDSFYTNRWLNDSSSGSSPALAVVAHAPTRGVFSFRQFFESAYAGLNELSPNQKRAGAGDRDGSGKAKSPGPCKQPNVEQLKTMLIEAISIKKPAVMLIDEAQYLVRVKSNITKGANLEVIRTIANAAKINIVMFCTSEAREMLYASAPLSRRVTVVHFRRYQKYNIQDIGHYMGAFQSVVQALNISINKNIFDDWEYMYVHGLGCVGVLVEWLMRAYGFQISKNDARLAMSHFKHTRLSDAALSKMLRDALAFEAQQSNEDRFDYDRCVANDMFGQHFYLGDADFASAKVAPSNKRKPGKRSPVRDPVGNSSRLEGSV